MAELSSITLPDGNTYDFKDATARELIPPTMTILSYGNSTWDDFIAAYNTNTIVYCRASSNSNPASGKQTRMAFMAYVNNNPPTEVQFQYYRSVSSHSATQQGDQVFIYKLNKTSGWSVTTREAMSKIAAGTGLSSSYSNGTITLSANAPDLSNYIQKTDYASTSTAGVVKVDGTSITVNDGIISASTYTSIENIVDGDSTGSIRQISALQPNSTYTMGSNSFAEGYNTKASRQASHAEGYYTIAEGAYQHVEGKYNVPDYNDKYAHIVGNGASLGSQSNAHTLEWNGNAWYAGKVTAGANATNAMDLVTLHQLQTALPSPLSSFHTTVGDGTTTSFTINHYLNTKNILVSVNITDNNITYIAPLTSLAALSQIGYAVIINSNDSITISFTSAPASNAAEISIISAIAYSSASDENLLRIS